MIRNMYKYTPTRFMLPTSHYDKAKADRAVNFIQCLRHTKGDFYNQPFRLLPWQETVVRDLFGVLKADDTRQFRTAYVETAKSPGRPSLPPLSRCISSAETASSGPRSTAQRQIVSRRPLCMPLPPTWCAYARRLTAG